MSETGIEHQVELNDQSSDSWIGGSLTGDGRTAAGWNGAARARDRKFWLGLAAATLLHALFLIGIGILKPEPIGHPSGAEDAFSVEMITEAELKSRSAASQAGGAGPGQPATAPPPVPPVPEPPPQPKAEPPAEAQLQPDPQTAPEPEAKPQEKIKPSLTEEISEPLPVPEPTAVPGLAPAKKTPAAEIKPPPPSKPQQKRTAALDLTPPKPSFSPPMTGGGGPSGFERPPGITKSGANDEFARRVIAALQRTMPQLRNTLGRVTVRIVLNQNGNLADVKVVKPSTIANLDQSVIFATQQTSYPFPPPNSKDVDRIFTVTYIYY